MSVVMKSSPKKVLPFPKPPEEPAASMIVVQIGSERFALHWKMEELPPAAPMVRLKRPSKQASMQIVK
jgi:hypothetical protein